MTLKSYVITTAQAATVLGVSRSTVRRHVVSGDLRGFPGRVTKASIEEFMGESIQWPEEEEEATDE
jgi:excisionase family DNA binding protein|tara:strand:- start:605 stop:802 length:198 start_codon:yes stop_codon:yes gene_type:complete